MPIPCTNCVRFHYGQCYEAVKYCRVCGGINHIERYCPSSKTVIQRVRGEPLAGTRPWQEMHGLQYDAELRNKVLQSLKTSPGTAIHVNGVCIYRGYEKHFVKEEELRGRTLEKRMGERRRSRSPNYGRLSKSPPQRGYKGEPPLRGSGNRYRERSPVRRERRRTPSPYRHASPPSFYRPLPPFVPRSPRLAAKSSNAVVFEAHSFGAYQNRTVVGAQERSAVEINNNSKLGYLPDAPSAQHELREISGNVQASFATPTKTQRGVGPMSPALAGETIIDDPYFVLGVTKSAGDTEIIEAFRARMQEVETERALELDIDAELSNDYDNSFHILNAAKNQLLGIGSESVY